MNTKQQEKVVKGFAHETRIKVLGLLARGREVTLTQISKELRNNIKTTAMHVGKLEAAGLVTKNKRSLEVFHKLTPRGAEILKFLQKLD